MQTAYANEADYRMCCIHNVTAQLTVILQWCTDMEIMADIDKKKIHFEADNQYIGRY